MRCKNCGRKMADYRTVKPHRRFPDFKCEGCGWGYYVDGSNWREPPGRRKAQVEADRLMSEMREPWRKEDARGWQRPS